MADVNIVDGVENLSINCEGNGVERFRKCKATSSKEKMEECFSMFDLDKDGFLDAGEFSHFLRSVFTNKGQPYILSEKQEQDILKLLDENQDGKIDKEEFHLCWFHWLKQILDPVTALIIVDVQNDFIDGSLAIKNCPAGQDGGAVVGVINKILDETKFDLVVYSADWHPEDHISFIENVQNRKFHKSSKIKSEDAVLHDTVVFDGKHVTEQKLWPAHCVQNTSGAKMHPSLKIVEGSLKINKGTNPDIDSYSAFWDNKKLSQTPLLDKLTNLGVTEVYVCGLAYDVCVGSTAFHSIEYGFRTVVIDDACRGVCLADIESTKEQILRLGGIIVNSSEVKDMVDVRICRPELGYQAALNVAMARKLVKENSKK